MASLAECVWERRPLGAAGIVDMHGHMGRWVGFPIRGADAESIVAQMDRVGVEKVVCSHQAVLTPEAAYGNDRVLEAMERFPGRILGYAITWPLEEKLCLDEVKRCMDRGMVGIKLHDYIKIPYTSELYAPVWKYADERGLPVLLHTWGDLKSLEPIFKSYGGAPILLAHAGAVLLDEYVRYAAEYANLYLDITASGSRYGLVEHFVRHVSARRVVFGSDVPWMPIAHQIGRVVFADITEEEKKTILVDNPSRILSPKRGHSTF